MWQEPETAAHIISTVQSREKERHAHSASPLYSYTIQEPNPGRGITHRRLVLPTAISLIKKRFRGLSIGQLVLDIP